MAELRLIDANAYEYPGDLIHMPTIDAVPVVRCVECIHRCTDCCPMCHEEYYYDEDDGGDWVTRDMTVDDGFCHMGEKMEGGSGDV